MATGEVTEPPYAGWLPGPWLDLTEYADDAEETEFFCARCEVCGNEVSVVFDYADEEGSMEEFRRVEVSARQEWEGHVAEEASQDVRYFLLPGIGSSKSSRVGTWADVIEAVPYLLFPGDPMPPMVLLNIVLMEADGHAGMSGGVEWPRHQLTEVEYQDACAALVERLSLVEIDAPLWVRSREDLRAWAIMVKSGCGRAAAEAWLSAVMEAGGGDALIQLHERRDVWLREFESQTGTP